MKIFKGFHKYLFDSTTILDKLVVIDSSQSYNLAENFLSDSFILKTEINAKQ